MNCFKSNKLLLILLLTISINLYGQRNCGLSNNYSAYNQSLQYSTDGTAFVELCLSRLQFTNQKINVYTMSGISNCYATIIGNQPSIIIDQKWLESCRVQDDWFYIYVLGHEIGHILLKHIYFSDNEDPWIKELSADLVGGILLRKFNYPNNDVERIIPSDFSLLPSVTHPPRELRVKTINQYLKSNDERKLISIIGWYGINKDLLNINEQRKIENLNQALYSFNKFESRIYFDDVYLKINALSDKQYKSIPTYKIVSFLHSAIRLGYISVNNFAEQLLKLESADNKKNHFILEVAPYFKELSLVNQKLVADRFNWETLTKQDLNKNSLLNLARLSIPLAFKGYISNNDLRFLIKEYLPSQLKRDTNLLEFVSIMINYSNFIGDYIAAGKYNKKEINLISALYMQNKDPYYSYQLGKAYYNQGLISFRLENYEKALESIGKARVYIPTEYRKELANELLYLEARIYLNLEMLNESLDAIKKFIPSTDPFELYIVGIIYLKNEKAEKARKYFEKSCNNKYYKSCEILKLYY